MAGPFKIILYLQQFGDTWTETYYTSTGSVSQFQNSLVQVGAARRGLAAKQTLLVQARVTDLSNPRQTQVLAPLGFAGPGTMQERPGSDPDQDSAPSIVSVQVKFYGTGGQQCRRYIAGVAEGTVGTNFSGQNISDYGTLGGALANFLAVLAGQIWQFRYRNQAANQIVQAVLTSAQFPGEIGVQFGQQMIALQAGVPPYLAFKGFRKVNPRLLGIGGIYKVDPASPGITAAVAPFIYYLRNTPNIQAANIAQLGVGAQLVYAYDGFSNTTGPTSNGFSILNATHHKRGGSALAHRGRLRARI